MRWPDRFWAKIDFRGDCWLWTGARSDSGYGVIWMPGGPLRHAHRVAYEMLVGPIPDGLTLDHLCRETLCVNPDHLEPVTQRENSRRGEGFCGKRARQDRCVHGHPFSLDNTYIRPDGNRNCRECKRRIDREYGRRKRRTAAA